MRFSRGRAGAIAALVLLGGAIGQGSSHREAPGITKTPKLDGTDFYMFRSYETNRSAYVTLVANYLPLQDPYGGPNYFDLDTSAVYEIHIDNNADAVEDITFQFRPSTLVKDLSVPAGNMMVPVPLINIGQIGPDASATSALNREESFSVNIIRGDRRNGAGQSISNAADGAMMFRKPVDNIGSKSIPQYATYANNHIYDIVIPGCDNGRMFVGQRKDSFVVNLGETFDLVNVTNPLGPENAEADDLADKNVTSFVLEVPIACLVPSASQPIIGGWTTASLGVGPVNTTPTSGATPCPAGTPAAPRPADGPGLVWVPDQSCTGWVPNNHPAARGGPGAPPPPAAAFRNAGLAPRRAARQRSRDRLARQGPLQLGLAHPGLGARELRHEPDASRVARDPLRRRRRAGAKQLPARRSGGGVPDRHRGTQQTRDRRRVGNAAAEHEHRARAAG